MDRRITRFNKSVEAFLGKHDLSDIASIVSQGLINDFLVDPNVAAYLTRPGTHVQFDEAGEPILESEYERQFYDACCKSEKDVIPYRAHNYMHGRQGTDRKVPFYAEGTTDSLMKPVLNRLIQKEVAHQRDPSVLGSDHVFFVCNGDDTYQISGVLRRLQGEKPAYDRLGGKLEDAFGRKIILPKTGHSFLVFPSGRDNHAITFFAVVDNAARKVIRTGVCNSWHNKDYVEAVRKRMNMDVDPEYAPNIIPFPLVDCSNQLQTNDADHNCALYRHHLSRALMNLFENDADVRGILADPNASDKHVSQCVKEGIKGYLPEYYHPTQKGYTKASEAEKRQVHLHTRWEADNAFLLEKIAAIKKEKHLRTQK